MAEGRKGRPPAVSPELRQGVQTLFVRGGLSVRDICLALERAGIPAPFGGERWHPSTVGRILASSGIRAPRGRPARLSPARQTAATTPLHRLTEIAWRRRRPGAGSDLWAMLEREGKLDPTVRFEL